MLRRVIKALLFALLRTKSSPVGSPPQRMMVFAPHQDDETLCCGGAIAAATHAGATVYVAYLTDGGKSDSAESSARIARLRRQEAINACAVLGVPEERVLFLGFPDGDLQRHHDAALAAVKAALAAGEPEEVYVPVRFDGHPDHKETNRLVRLAVSSLPADLMIYECPVWAFNNWPFVRPDGIRLNRYWLIRTFKIAACFIRCINVRREIHTDLSRKREALSAHASQLSGASSIKTVSGGDWLQSFFVNTEFYYAYESRGSEP